MKFQSLLALSVLATSALAAPSKTLKKQAPCSSPVTLSGNPFSGRTLHANSRYRAEVEEAVGAISDSSLAAKAAKVADIGTFLWA